MTFPDDKYDDIAAFNADIYQALAPIYTRLARWQAEHSRQERPN